jgi:menaquinone-dependent protoporphyrinogen oxidase
MNQKILVGYASRYGSTQQVAEQIAMTLREHGRTVDVQPMSKVRNVAEYAAVILGAPLYLGAWHKDAVRFLTQHQPALTQRPVAIFALGPTHSEPEEWQGSRAQLDQELAKFSWLAPVTVEMFGGKYDPAKLHLPDKLIASLPASPLHGMPASDARDWAAMRAWANNLAAMLQPA